MRNYIALLLAGLCVTAIVAAQNPSDRFRASTTAVVVDVVVHDKQHRPVRGLTADDFAVFEDGKAQQITSFVAIDVAAADTTGATSTTGAPQSGPRPDDPPAVVALVFQDLGPTGRNLASKAGARLIRNTVGAGGFAGIFTVDLALHVVAPYTSDQQALEKGLRTASTNASPSLEPATPVAVMDCNGGGGTSTALWTFDALGAVISSMEHLPGRKSLVLFSEGIETKGWLCDNRRDRYLRLVAQANRAHVAFYSFDAAGLRIESTVAQADGAPYVGLTMLANDTGGAFVDNTNDLSDGVDRIAADLRQYYLLGYAPTKAADDKYRTIEVKVKGEGLTILARKGYRASRDAGPAVVRPAEVPALLLLDLPTHADAIPLLVSTLRMPEPDAPGKTALVARVPLDAVTFASPAQSSPPTGRLTVLARVENKKGDVVHYAAQTYDLTARPGQRDAGGSILFFTEAALPLEPLSVGIVALDAVGRKGSVRTTSLDASADKSGVLRVGDLIIANQMRPRQAEASHTNANGVPFGNVDLLPNLGEPVAAGSQLVVAFQAVADHKHGALEASLDLKRDGAVVTSLPLRLPEPKDDGLLRFATRFSTERLQPGSYVLTLTVRQDKASVERTAALTIRGASGAAVP